MSAMKTKACGYGCNTEIFWDDSIKRYCEVNNRQPHRCPNYKPGLKPIPTSTSTTTTTTTPTSTASTTNSRQVMENSFVYLNGPPGIIRRGYEKISDLVRDAGPGSKIHGSTRGLDSHGELDLVVFFEVPQGYRENVHVSMNQFFEALKRNS